MRKAVAVFSLVLVALLILPLASELVVSHYRRWTLSHLINAVRGFHPGTTTESQVRAALAPFSRYEYSSHRESDGVVVDTIEYQFFNNTERVSSFAEHLRFLPFPVTLPWTLFSVDLTFVDGILVNIFLSEMQEDQSGFPHPNAASVCIVTNRLPLPRASLCGLMPPNFNGYSEFSSESGRVNEKGEWTGFSCCHTRHIELDERATPAQHAQSFNFQLDCMTSFARCKDDRQILP